MGHSQINISAYLKQLLFVCKAGSILSYQMSLQPRVQIQENFNLNLKAVTTKTQV